MFIFHVTIFQVILDYKYHVCFFTYLSFMHKNEENGNLVAFYVEIFVPRLIFIAES